MPREFAPAMTGANRIAKRKTRDFDVDNTIPDTNAASQQTHTQHQEQDRGHARKKIHLPQKEHKYPSVNELKKRIRDVKRLLNKADLPADARIVQERALAGYENDLEEELKRRDRSKMIKKYHFVRFLDRKTASKDISRLTRREKEIAGSSTLESKEKERKLKALAEKLHVARVNLNYTIYYPLSEKYIALYAEQKKKTTTTTGGKGDGEDSDDDARFGPIHMTVAEKPGMWHVVEKCMEEGTLEELRDGKMKVDVDVEVSGGVKKSTGEKKKGAVKEAKKNAMVKEVKGEKITKGRERVESGRSERSKRRAAAREDYARRNADKDDGEESDGGFFEM